MNVNPMVAWICSTALLLAVLAGMFALSWHDKSVIVIVLPIVGTIAAAAVAVFGVHAGVNAGANAASKTPPA